MSQDLKKVGVGVVGLGQFGEKHVHALSTLPNVDLIAVCSRREGRAEEIAKKFGAKMWFTDKDRLVSNPDVEVVDVVVAENEHKDPVIAAAEAGKDVLCEKPIALTLEDADEMISATRKAGVKFMVGHILRFDPRYAIAKKEIEEGAVGKIVSIYGRRNIPAKISGHYLQRVSSIIDDGLHDTDLMHWYTEDRISRAYGESVNVRGLPNADIGWGIYKFRKGAVGVIEDAWFLPDNTPFSIDARMEIIGTEGAIYIDVSDECVQINDRTGWRLPDTIHWPTVHGKVVGALKEEISYFIGCVAKDEEPTIVTPEDARNALEAVLAVEKSINEGKPVTLPLR